MFGQRESVGVESNGEWRVEITTPDGQRLRPTATLVELCTADGQIGVMPGHERLLTVLEVGELTIHNGREREVYLVGGGFAQIQPGRLSVLAFSIEPATDGTALERCRARLLELTGDGEESPMGEAADEWTLPPISVAS